MKPPPLTIVTTGNDVAGHEIVQYLGIVRGIVVRSTGIGRGFIGGIRSLGWGQYTGIRRSLRGSPTTGLSIDACSRGGMRSRCQYRVPLRCDRVHAGLDGSPRLRNRGDTPKEIAVAFRGSLYCRCRPFADSCRDVALPLIINRLRIHAQHPGTCHRPRLADS